MNEDIQIQQRESIKLMKMSKGYNWEIKLLSSTEIDDQLVRLEKLNKEMVLKFGGPNA